MKQLMSLFLFFSTTTLIAQQDVWDIPLTEAQIALNKRDYRNHKTLATQQEASTVTVKGWRRTADKVKALSDSLDKRLQFSFILLADLFTLYDVYGSLRTLSGFQAQALKEAARHPWMVPFIAERELRLLREGRDLLNYTTLLVLSYGSVSKMAVEPRRALYGHLARRLTSLNYQAYSILCFVQRITLTTAIGSTGAGIIVNRDAQIAKDIATFQF
jgi:hypothetical protein